MDRKFARSGQRKRGFERRGFGNERRLMEREMYSATCSKCGQRCEVPFKPSGAKPVYCDNCFRKDDKFESKAPDQYAKEFQRINEKLDIILEAIKN